MRIKVSLPVADANLLREKILEGAEKVERDDTTQEDWEAVCSAQNIQSKTIKE